MRKIIQDPKSSLYNSNQKVQRIHESAIRQVCGSANYVDDITEPSDVHFAAVGSSDATSGKITHIDLSQVWASPGVVDVITVDDVPGHTDIGPVFKGDPILAENEIKFHGQPVFAVLADTQEHARIATKLGLIAVEPNNATLEIKQAKARELFVRPPHQMRSGDVEAAMAQSTHIVSDSLTVGGQEHLYLEGQVSMALPSEDRMFVYTSSQHPSEVQKLVAEVLDIALNKVTVDMRRMGGGFGGKETQAAQWACIAAIFAQRQNCGVKIRLARQQDMIMTGKRHPFENHYTVGFDEFGKINAAKIEVNGNCGHSPDLSDAIVDRAMFHADNAYYYPHAQIDGHRCQTNQVSHTAFRGFGGPQGMIMAEAIMDKVARATGKDPLDIRKLNLYGEKNGLMTPYGMTIEHNLLPDIIKQLELSSDYWSRRKQIKSFNELSPIVKKGLALTPVKFGISFTAKHLNQAGALIHIYTDGSVQANHGGTEMGQGLHTKIGQIVAREFGLDLDTIEVTSTRTDKVPNTSPTAASSGTDLNGKAAQNAAKIIKRRLAEFFLENLNIDLVDIESEVDKVAFANKQVTYKNDAIQWTELVQQAYFARVSLSSTGFYKTPKIEYNRDTGKGRPFFYFAYGAAVSEVSIDTLTGEYIVDRVDILHDVGTSINPAIDIGQIEGGFIQGMGWLCTEDLVWDNKGRLSSNNLATYKIPSIGDTPEIFNVNLFDRPNAEDSIYHSKAVGEPPFMLAISVWCAIKDAISSICDYTIDPTLHTPATPEKVLNAVLAMQMTIAKGTLTERTDNEDAGKRSTPIEPIGSDK